MTVELPRVLRNVSIGYLGGILSLAFGFAMKVIAIRVTSVTEFGMFSAVLSLMSIALGIAQLGLQDGIARTTALHHAEPGKRVAVLRDGLILGLLMTLVIVVPLSLASGVIGALLMNGSQSTNLLWLLWLVLPLWVAANLIAAYLQGLGRISLRVLLVDVSRMATFCVVVLVVAPLPSFAPLSLLLFALVIGIVISFLITLWQAYSTFAKPAPQSFRRDLLHYSLPLFAGNLITLIVTSGNVLALGALVGPTDAAFYSALLAVGQLVGLGGIALDVVLLPTFTHLYTENRRTDLSALYRTMTRLSLLISAPIALIMVLVPDFVLSLLFGAKYVSAAPALRLVALFFMLHIAFGPNEAALKMTGYTRSLLGIRFATVVWMILVGWTLATQFGYLGMIIGWGFGLLLYNGMLWAKLRHIIG